MKKNIISVLTLFLCMVMLASCSGLVQPESTETAEGQGRAIVSVYVEDEDRFVLENMSVEIKEGDTAFEILKRVTREKKIHMEFEGNAETAYVVGMDNLYSLDKGKNSGWMFYVNGEMAEIGPGSLEVNDGDRIEWIYVLDWTMKD